MTHQLNEIERYIPKDLKGISSTAVPIHPSIILELEKTTKEKLELRKKLLETETRLSNLQDVEDRIKYLEYFVDQFTLYCISDSANVSILRCAKILSMGFCSMKNICKPRLALGKKLNYI